jgi:hypothetical protein
MGYGSKMSVKIPGLIQYVDVSKMSKSEADAILNKIRGNKGRHRIEFETANYWLLTSGVIGIILSVCYVYLR